MKKLKSLILLIAISLPVFLLSCEKDKDPDINPEEFKEIAWNSIAEKFREDITHPWQEAGLEIVKNPDGDEKVVVVYFHTTYEALTCGISVYIYIDSKEVFYPENIAGCL